MASTMVVGIGALTISAISKTCGRSSDLERRGLSSKLCSSSGISSFRATCRREIRCRSQPWRRSAQSSRKSGRAVVRSQAISSDSIVEKKEKVGETEKEHELVIVGAGIAGLAAAAAVNKIGVKSLVLEQAEALRTTGSSLTLWRNAWHVLDILGVGDKLRSMYSPITCVQLYDQRGDLLRAFELDECPQGPHEVRGVERKLLIETLASVLPQGTIRFNARVISIKRASDACPFELTLSDGSVIRTKVLLGADGVNSVVAKWLGLSQTRYVGQVGIRGLAVYDDGHPFDTSVRQYCGAGERVGVSPISPTKVYWFFLYNKSNAGPKVTDPNQIREELLALIEGWPAMMKDLLDHTPVESLSRAALSDRWHLPGTTPLVQNGVTLAGDALHPMTPNLGQGGCCALEDAIILARTLGPVLAQGGAADYERINKALEEYAAERLRRTLPLTIRAFAIGTLLQIPFAPVVFIRNKLAIPRLLSPGSFLNHTLYNPGQLPVAQYVKK